jgi:hypothetical protein
MDMQELHAWAMRNPQQAIAMARKARVLRATIARDDVNVFMEHVMHEEGKESKAWVQSKIHRRFQKLATDHDRLILWAHMEAGKTQQISVGRTLWELGRNPDLRVAIFASAQESSRKIAKQIARYIESSHALHEVFPDLVPGLQWSADSLTIKRKGISKDPSIQCAPIYSGRVMGSRLDRAILDDVLTYENAFSEANSTKLWDWYNKTVPGRMVEGGKIYVIGNAYGPDDFLHTLAKNSAWYWEKFPLFDENGVCTWPEAWGPEKIALRKLELSPEEWARQMQCVARDDASSRFRRVWLDQCKARGEGKLMAVAINDLPSGYSTHTGVDLGSRQHKKSDQTVLFTYALCPNGDKEILEVQAGRWDGAEIVQRIIDVHRRFHSIVYVEDVHAQRFIVDFTKAMSGVSVVPFTTDSRKNHPEFGIEHIAVEMSNSKWVIPNEGTKCHPEVEALLQEMLYYDPKAHTGDRLMAMWIGNEGARRQKPKIRQGMFTRKL